MRNTARWAATLGLTATAVCGPLTGAALADPAAAYAPLRPVGPRAHPRPRRQRRHRHPGTGRHPDLRPDAPRAPIRQRALACAELRAAGGDFDALGARADALCTREYDPVVVTVDGVWRGKRVSYERTFANECVKSSYGTSLFAF